MWQKRLKDLVLHRKYDDDDDDDDDNIPPSVYVLNRHNSQFYQNTKIDKPIAAEFGPISFFKT